MARKVVEEAVAIGGALMPGWRGWMCDAGPAMPTAFGAGRAGAVAAGDRERAVERGRCRRRPADRRIEVSAARGRSVTLSIRDHGPGVAPAIADRIFDPFFTTKQVGSGLGLGLSISYNIMKDFGGDLRVATIRRGARCSRCLRQATAKAVAAE
jgi:hypothetical protein